MAQWKHRLKKLDPEARTAICEHCGPVKIHKNHKDSWKCGNSRKQYPSKNKYQRPRKIIFDKPIKCQICLLEKPLCWDHDHKTGNHRGWLCINCNVALGNFYDDTGNLDRAINYLLNSRA